MSLAEMHGHAEERVVRCATCQAERDASRGEGLAAALGGLSVTFEVVAAALACQVRVIAFHYLGRRHQWYFPLAGSRIGWATQRFEVVPC